MNGLFRSSFGLAPLIAIALVGFLGLTACGEDGGIGEVDRQDFVYTPLILNFQQVAIGDSQVSSIFLTNNAERSITLTNLQITAGENENVDAFTILDPWEQFTLEGGESAQIQVEYSPSDSVRYSGTLSFGTTVADTDVVEIPVAAATPRPEIFAPERVSFTRTAPGTLDYQVVEVTNIGFAPLNINSIDLSGAAEFSIAFPGDDLTDLDLDSSTPPESIDPDQSFFIRVLFDAVDDEFRSAVLTINSNDPVRSSLLIAVTANSNAPCLELEESEVNFGLSSIGHTSRRTVTLRNCSDVADTIITDIALEDNNDDLFGIVTSSLPTQLQNGNNAVIGPRSTISFLVSYTPTMEQVDQAILAVRSNDAARPTLRADIRGEGSNFECPIANARGRVRGTLAWQGDFIAAVPLDEVEFNSDESFDPDGTNLSYQWTLVERPPSSGAFFAPNSTVASPNLFLDIAGRYVIELTVFDGYGLTACEASRLTIEAAPDSDIHVELTWTVGASPSGTGVDLDLHYKHPNGNWGAGSPWEIYYANNNEDWGNDGTVSLDIDDLTGAEPENINHNDPGGSPGNVRTYAAGVYYFSNSSQYPNVDATMRIYLSGQLVRQLDQRLVNAGAFAGTGDFWWAANVPWDGVNLDVENVNVVYEGGFSAANAGGGD